MMMSPNFTLYITYLIMANMARMTLMQSSLHFDSVNAGGSVTLHCFCEDEEAVMVYWYKQTLGQKPKLMSTFYKHKNNNGTFHDEFENNPRFSLDNGNHKHHLKITHLQILDSATYYCVRSNLYDFEFCDGTTVIVKDSVMNTAVVHQPDSETIQPGGSVILSCIVKPWNCDGEHNVYWFKDSGESNPGIIYTQGDKNNQCERKPETQTHSCVYNFIPMDRLNGSHGTYCAVASCGRILFGNSKVDVVDKHVSPVLVHFLSGALAFTTILLVCLAVLLYRLYKSSQHTDLNCSATSPANAELCQDEENLHYAAFMEHRVNKSRRLKDTSECIYSSVKQ